MIKTVNTLIVSGGNINEELINEIFLNNKFDNIIACDKGLEELDKCSILPTCIIGDFDSINKTILDKYINKENIEITRLNSEKDYTDTHVAIKKAIQLKSTNVVIIGAIGTRIDHTLANINVLNELLDSNIDGRIIDSNNEIRLLKNKTVIEENNSYKYVSLLPLTTSVKGITLNGFKYPLENATLNIGHSVGISNEQICKNASIDIKEGILILIRSRD